MKDQILNNIEGCLSVLSLSVMSFGKKNEKKESSFIQKTGPIPGSNVVSLEPEVNHKIDSRVKRNEIGKIVERLVKGSPSSDEDIESLLDILRLACKNSPNELTEIMQSIKKHVFFAIRHHETVIANFYKFEEVCNVFLLSLFAHLKNSNIFTADNYNAFKKEFEGDNISIDTVFDIDACKMKPMKESLSIAVECRYNDFKKILDVFEQNDSNKTLSINIESVESVVNILASIDVNIKNRARLLKAALFNIAEHVLTTSLQDQLIQGKIGQALEKFKKIFVKEFIAPLQIFADELSFLKNGM